MLLTKYNTTNSPTDLTGNFPAFHFHVLLLFQYPIQGPHTAFRYHVSSGTSICDSFCLSFMILTPFFFFFKILILYLVEWPPNWICLSFSWLDWGYAFLEILSQKWCCMLPGALYWGRTEYWKFFLPVILTSTIWLWQCLPGFSSVNVHHHHCPSVCFIL